MDELLINIREKTDYETYSAYLEDIKKNVEKQNSNVMKAIMQKDSEIAELKAQLASLQAEKANEEKSVADANVFETVNDVLLAVKENDSKTDTIITKFDEIIKTQDVIEQQCRTINDKLNELDNVENAQYDIKKQEELEDIAKDIYAVVMELKRESMVPFKENENSSDLSINNGIETPVAEEAPVEEPNNNIIEEKQDSNQEVVAPVATPNLFTGSIDDLAPVAPSVELEGSEKVVAAEPATPEVTEAAKQSISLDPSNTKVVRSGVNYIGNYSESEAPFEEEKAQVINNTQLPDDFIQSFKGLEQTIGRVK